MPPSERRCAPWSRSSLSQRRKLIERRRSRSNLAPQSVLWTRRTEPRRFWWPSAQWRRRTSKMSTTSSSEKGILSGSSPRSSPASWRGTVEARNSSISTSPIAVGGYRSSAARSSKPQVKRSPMPSYKISKVRVKVKPGVTLTADVSSAADVKQLLKDLEEEGFASPIETPRRKGIAVAKAEPQHPGDESPLARIETRAALAPSKLVSAKILAFKDS